MTGITCYDTAYNNQFPGGAPAYAAYVDGGIGNQPNFAHVVSAYPSAHHLSIALFADHDADALDVEPGAAMVADIAKWVARQKARGIQRPVIYASADTMEAEVVPVVTVLPGARAAVRLWTAHYGLGEHICGPKSCGALSIDADGTQWTSSAKGLVLDQSLLAADFFGTSPLPANWVYPQVRDLVLVSVGPSSVKLSWVSPLAGPMPLPGIGSYEIAIAKGGTLTGPDVKSYPRYEPKGTNPAEVWQGGSLEAGTKYTAGVRALDKNGQHAGPWATVTFTTKA